MLNILRTILPSGVRPDEDVSDQELKETLTTIAAVTAAVLIVAFIAVLMGMT